MLDSSQQTQKFRIGVFGESRGQPFTNLNFIIFLVLTLLRKEIHFAIK